MTSFIIGAHTDRRISKSWKQHSRCPFCRIANGDAPAYKFYENDLIVAFLGHYMVDWPAASISESFEATQRYPAPQAGACPRRTEGTSLSTIRAATRISAGHGRSRFQSSQRTYERYPILLHRLLQ